MAELDVLPPSDTPDEVAIATSLIPWRKDDYRARYLGYLACGFMPEEALYMLGKTMSWLESVRQEADFASSEYRVPEFRKELSKEFLEIDFFRNYRMVMEKDKKVLRISLGMEIDEEGNTIRLTPYDNQYLLKMRSSYTPQQLQILEQVIKGTGSDWNFADWIKNNRDVIEYSRTDTVKIEHSNA